ncbi:MFS transporter [Candidatus Uhrbacteria bacterium]|nr:MFS transporter [Candidatus Uhrbacteria bacterium]
MAKKVLPILFFTLFLDMIGIGMVIPIIPAIFTDPSSPSFLLHGYSQNAQFFIAGITTALFGLMQFIAAPILGELSDIYGRKRLLTLGISILAVSQLIFGFGIQVASLAMLFFSRALAGLAGANFSIAQACIADVTEPKDRAKNFGLMGAAFGIGIIFGPLLGGWIATHAQHAAAPFWVASALGIFNWLFISLFLPETRKKIQEKKSFTILKGIHNIRSAFQDVDTRPLYLTNFLYISGSAFFTSFIGILLVSRYSFSVGSIGTFFAVVGFWMVLTQSFILRIISGKYSERMILRYSFPVAGLTIALFPFLPNSAALYVLIPFLAIPQGLSMANMMALISRGVSAQKQGAALGINGSLMALSNGIIPIVAGTASAFIGLQIPFIAGAVCVGLAWMTLFVFHSEQSQQ